MDGRTFEGLVAWQAQDPKNRSVKLEFKGAYGVEAYVYDFALMVGQFVTSADEIDLEAQAERRDRQQLAALIAKYGVPGEVTTEAPAVEAGANS